MKLTWRDGVATLLFAGIVLPYAAYLIWGPLTIIGNGSGGAAVGLMDPTGMSALALVLGLLAAVVGGWIALSEGNVVRYLTGGVGLLSVVLGLLALIGENLFNNTTLWEGVLAAFIGTIVVLWGIAIGRHAGLVAETDTTAHAGMTPA